jgi:CRP-like cAMP-binding protein
MGRPQQIDRDALHRVLWAHTDRFQRLPIVNQEVAEYLCISPYHFSRILREGVQMERWRVVSVGKNSRKTYEIRDPAVWAAGRNGARS